MELCQELVGVALGGVAGVTTGEPKALRKLPLRQASAVLLAMVFKTLSLDCVVHFEMCL